MNTEAALLAESDDAALAKGSVALPPASPGNAVVDAVREKLRALKRVYVSHPGANQVLKALDRLINYGNLGFEVHSPARCLLLTGLSGSGKSALLRRWAAQFPMTETREHDIRPVLYVEVPPKCTLKALAELMLRTLGQPEELVARGTEVSLTERVKVNLRDQGVRVVILDEFQHLIDSKSDRVIRLAADFVKGLLNASICPFVLAGTPEAAAVYDENVQLKRRSFGRHALKPFDWNVQDDCTFFRTVLDEYERQLPFEQPSDLARKAIALRIHHFSNGLLGRAVDLIVAATIRALEEGEPCLSYDVLRETVEEFREDDDPEWFNPFDVPELQPLEAPRAEERRTRVTRLRRGNRGIRQADLLRA